MGRKKWSIGRNPSKVLIPQDVKNAGAYRNIMSQVNRIALHDRQCSIQTRERYYEAVERLCRYLADEFRLEKFANLRDLHIVTYIEHMTLTGKSSSTIKTDLAAIRHFHDQVSNPRFIISPNDILKQKYSIEIQRRRFGGIDRSWTDQEFSDFIQKANQLGRYDIKMIMQLCRFLGLRIHEAVRLDRADAEYAVRTCMMRIKGKGGLVREIKVDERALKVIFQSMVNTKRGQKLFVPDGKKAHEVMSSVEQFIYRHRTTVQQANRQSNLTAHGLRHSFAAEQYMSTKKNGLGEQEARKEVARTIGHRRSDVTRIYTGPFYKKEDY